MAVVRGESEKQDGTWTKTYTYYAKDHLGTVRFVYTLDSSGNLVSSSTHDYSPFGVEIGPVETSGNTHKYTGQERDPETGNDYMHYRFYGDSIGRFMKPDNVSGTMENPQDWNLYSYTHGNPITFDDPTGHGGQKRTREAGGSGKQDYPKEKERQQKVLTAKAKPKANANQQAQHEADQTIKGVLKKAGLQVLTAVGELVSNNPIGSALVGKLVDKVEDKTGAWDGHKDAKDAVVDLTGGGAVEASVDLATKGTAEVAAETSTQAAIAAGGGTAETVTTGFLGSGLTTASGLGLVGAAGAGGYAMGTVINNHLPDSTKEIIGDTVLGMAHTVGLFKGLND